MDLPFFKQNEGKYEIGDVVIRKEPMGCNPKYEPPYWIIVNKDPVMKYYCLKYPIGDKPSDGVAISSLQHDSDIMCKYAYQEVPEKYLWFIEEDIKKALKMHSEFNE